MAKTESSGPMGLDGTILLEHGTVDDKYKVHIPKGFLEFAEWSLPPDWKAPIVVEIRELGRIRLYLGTDASPKVEALRQKIEDSDASDKSDRLSVFADRYHDVQLYKDDRIHLTHYIVTSLGVDMTGDRTILIEARKSYLEFMSMDFRNRRLKKFDSDFI